MYRSDYKGPLPSARLQALIERRGGKNIFGQPNYRLVHSEFRRTPSAGTWVDWDDSLGVNERNEERNAPVRRVVETRQILSYPNQKGKWVLEKWVGPEAYGTPKDWYKPIPLGGTMLYVASERKNVATLGEYPSRGEYENVSYAFPTDAVTEVVLLTAIGRLEKAIDKMPSTPEGRMLRRVYNALRAEELKQQQYKLYAKELLDETDFAFSGNPFSGSGIKRPHSSKKLLNKLGITQHHID